MLFSAQEQEREEMVTSERGLLSHSRKSGASNPTHPEEAVSTPQQHLPFPTLLAASGRGPQESNKEGTGGQESRTRSSPVQEVLELIERGLRTRADEQTQRSQIKGMHHSIKGQQVESAAKTSHLALREMTEQKGLGHGLGKGESKARRGKEKQEAGTWESCLGRDQEAEKQGRSPSPREYTLKPDTFLARTDLGRLRRAGL